MCARHNGNEHRTAVCGHWIIPFQHLQNFGTISQQSSFEKKSPAPNGQRHWAATWGSRGSWRWRLREQSLHRCVTNTRQKLYTNNLVAKTEEELINFEDRTVNMFTRMSSSAMAQIPDNFLKAARKIVDLFSQESFTIKLSDDVYGKQLSILFLFSIVIRKKWPLTTCPSWVQAHDGPCPHT